MTDPEPPPPGDPIFDVPNLIVVPHIGSATRTARARMTELSRREPPRRPRRPADAPPGAVMRVAVVDIGTNSTRLLVADVGEDGGVAELERRTRVTRLGDGVDATGVLAPEAIDRVLATLDEYAAAIERLGAEARPAVLTSAVRDAANGAEFVATVEARYGLEARAIEGSEEARLTYLGATSGREPGGSVLVIDVGGGSTELVIGSGAEVEFAVSMQVGVVRQTERHLHTDPPELRRARPPRRGRARGDRALGAGGPAPPRRRWRSRSPERRRRARRSTRRSIPTIPRASTATASRSRRCACCSPAWPRSTSRRAGACAACIPTARRRSSPASRS